MAGLLLESAFLFLFLFPLPLCEGLGIEEGPLKNYDGLFNIIGKNALYRKWPHDKILRVDAHYLDPVPALSCL